ncbi:MAG: hypothetical protein JXA23_00885 [Bacteroidales bacterium]|nr:hypothetical protein [Bacteroidales bacterium]
MDREEFLAYINNPNAVDAQSLKQIEEVQKEFPFFQTAHLLYALNLYAEDHPHYAVQLKRASAYAGDRKQLKHLIDRYRITHPKPVTPYQRVIPVKTAVIPPSPEPVKPPIRKPSVPTFSPTSTKLPLQPITPSPASPFVTPSTSHPITPPPVSKRPVIAFKPVIPGSDEPTGGDSLREKLLEIVHRRLQEIAEEHGESREIYSAHNSELPPPESPVKQRVTFSVESTGHFSKEELIEKFIREEPRISSPRQVLLKPNRLSPRDIQDEDEIVSETLAILYHKQGNTGKSIRVYEKLCLLFPEKSSYFAARIEALKTQEYPENEENEFK